MKGDEESVGASVSGLPPPRPASVASGRTGVSRSSSAPPIRPSSMKKDETPDMLMVLNTKYRVYPIPAEAPDPRPLTETNKRRIERVREKNYMLREQFMGREKWHRPPSKGEKPFTYKHLPAWWSDEVHGLDGKNMTVPTKLHTVMPLAGIRKALAGLRMSLASLPWADGRPVLDNERRIRGEVQDMEVWMRNHVLRIVEAIYDRAKAPAVTPKMVLFRAFQRADVTQTGDVTVQEFCDVWNSPDTGLHLMIPIQKFDEMENLVDVKIKKTVKQADALALWEKSDRFPAWPNSEEAMAMESSRGYPLLRPKEVLIAHAAAFFMKYAYDKDGLLPYDVFINSLFTSPARMLGMEPMMNQKARAKHGFAPGDDFTFEGKILYQRAKKGVFPPQDFDPIMVKRSNKPPSAHMKLEYAYGYDGVYNLNNNLFYTSNPEEIVYYTAALGIVLNTVTNTQKHFFGHNNNIRCMAIHPWKWIVATGQAKQTGPTEVPYVCIWETRECKQLQRLDHPFDKRAIIASAFSPSGKDLITVGSDNPHSLFVWKWMTDKNKMAYLLGEKVDPALVYDWPKTIPAFSYGPEKKLADLKVDPTGFFWKPANKVAPPGDRIVINPHKKGDRNQDLGPAPTGLIYVPPVPDDAPPPPPPPPEDEGADDSPDAWMKGPDFALDPKEVYGGFNGAPPQIFGVRYNDFCAASEFVTYGVKHLNFWAYVKNPDDPSAPGRYEKTAGSFGPSKVDSPLSAVWIPDVMADYRETIRDKDTGKVFNKGHAKVTHTGKIISFHRDSEDETKVVKEEYIGDRDVSDLKKIKNAILLTGFPSGELGIWVGGIMMRCVEAHAPGPQVCMPDGMVTFWGLRAIKLRADFATVLTGGADGKIVAWDVRQTVEDEDWMKAVGSTVDISKEFQGLQKAGGDERKEQGSALRGGAKALSSHSSTTLGRGSVKIKQAPGNWKLKSPYPDEPPPSIRSVDSRPGSSTFIAGTNKSDIWEMFSTGDPRVLINGAVADVRCCATHPRQANLFATVAESSVIRVWDATKRCMARATSLGFQCRSVQFSTEGSHIAVGGKKGRLRILVSSTLQPLITFKDCISAIDEIKYSPNNRVMCTGSHDLYIDLYDTGFRGPGGVKGAPGKVVKWPQINTMWEKDVGGKGEYVHLARCSGHSASICHIDFSLPLFNPPHLRGKTIICSNCNGYEILYWDQLTGAQILENQRNAKWHTRTTLLGFDVMGIWPEGCLNSQINALDRSHSQEYTITGDNFSHVKLFNHPVVHDDAPFRCYYGSSSFVCCTRFSCDDRWVIAVGGGDHTTFQYRTHGINKGDSLPENQKELDWCDVDECLYCGRRPIPPPPPPPWGPLDKAGKTWGLSVPKNGKCTCKNHQLHLEQEFLTFDTSGSGNVTKIELRCVLRSSGHKLTEEEFEGVWSAMQKFPGGADDIDYKKGFEDLKKLLSASWPEEEPEPET